MAWWDVLAETTAYPQFLAALGMVLLAAVLLGIDFNHIGHRAFAMLLVFRAIVMVASSLRGLYSFSPPPYLGGIGDPGAAAFWAYVAPYFVIPMPFLIVWFACVHPRRRTFLATTRWGPYLLVLAALAFEVVYALDHTTYVRSEAASLTVDGATWSTIAYRGDGPLAAFLGLMYLGFALMSMLFTYDYIRLPAGPRKRGLLFVVAGFILNGLYDGAQVVASLVADFGLLQGGIVIQLATAGLLPTTVALVMLGVHRSRSADPDVQRHILQLLLLAPLPVASAVFAVVNPSAGLGTVQLLLTGFWRLWLPALVTYALVRHQLFDIDLKIKFALKQSTMAGFAFVGFVVLSETLEAIVTSNQFLMDNIPERWSDIASLGIAVGLTYALNPIKAAATQVANRAMPHTENTEAYLARKRLEVFRATLEGAVEDGRMTEREQVLVERLRIQLGLTKTDIRPVMREVEAAYAGRTIGKRRGSADIDGPPA